MKDKSDEFQEASDPAQAFEDLRSEVWVMRRAVEALPGVWEENQPPDYSADLGRITKGLAVVADQLEAIDKHPVLKMTPEQYRQAIAQAGHGLMCEAERKFDEVIQGADRQREQLAKLIGTVRGQDAQRRVLWRTGGICFGVALVLGLVLSPYLVSVLFWGSWQTGVAATVMDASRWDAGAALMEAENPAGWKKLVNDWNLVQANQKEIAACREEAAKTKKTQRCPITVSAK
jgi:hypothetical protein